MDTPPNPSTGPSREPDLPKPPIWDRAGPAVPPIQIPVITPQPQSVQRIQPPTPPIVPDAAPPIPSSPIPPSLTATPPNPTPPRSLPQPGGAPQPVGQPYPATASTSIVSPAQSAMSPGPAFDRGYMASPASGAGVVDKPQWPSGPPTAGRTSAPAAPPAAKRPKRRIGLVLAALLIAAAVAAGAFFFGRSFSASDPAATQIAAPPSAPTEVPTQPPATDAPASPAPANPAPTIDATVPGPNLASDGADEPVVAVANAVAPAVVLITHELGQGSGIIYDEAGFILTNAHVVGQFTQVQVTLASGVRVPGQVLGADPSTDVAVVRIDTDSEYGVAVLAPESSVQVGQLAVAIGSPFGLEQTVTSGVVSAVGRVLENPIDGGGFSVVAMLQTDAPINPGNSGGALADRQGRVIGMNTSIRTDGSGGNIGVGFAIPADTAKLIAGRIIAGESLEQGFLGIQGGTPIIGDPGVVVGVVTPGSGAAAAGLQQDDLITGFNGQEIKSMSDLAAAVRLQPPEATVVVEFTRDGQSFTVDVTLGLLS